MVNTIIMRGAYTITDPRLGAPGILQPVCSTLARARLCTPAGENINGNQAGRVLRWRLLRIR